MYTAILWSGSFFSLEVSSMLLSPSSLLHTKTLLQIESLDLSKHISFYPAIPNVTGQSASHEVMAGHNLTLAVSISDFSLPLTSISWRQQGSLLTGAEVRVTITHPTLPVSTGPVTSTLVLSSTTPLDSGIYAVTATNAAGSDTLLFAVTVGGSYRREWNKIQQSHEISS